MSCYVMQITIHYIVMTCVDDSDRIGIVARQLAHHFNPIRRKFRSQTSDSMKRQTRERDRREEVREEKRQKKEDQGARKGRKSGETLCFSNVLWLRKVEK